MLFQESRSDIFQALLGPLRFSIQADAIHRRITILRDAGLLEEPSTASPPPRVASLTPGQVLSSYRIVELLGRGGMGEVYRAHDTKLGRDVAIKVLPDEFALDAERVRRFKRDCLITRILAI